MDRNEIILRFFMEDVGGILVTDGQGCVLFEDERARLIRQGRQPVPHPGRGSEGSAGTCCTGTADRATWW